MVDAILIMLLTSSLISNILLERKLKKFESDFEWVRRAVYNSSETIRSVEQKIVIHLKEK